MNIQEELHNTSRLLADMVADAIIETPELVDQALQLSKKGKHPYPMRVSRVIWILAERIPEIIESKLNEIFDITMTTIHESVRRNYLGVLALNFDRLTEQQLSKLIDNCLAWIESSEQPPAIKGQSMKILIRTGKKYPEIIPEIIGTIENQSEFYTSGVKAAAKNTIKILEKQIYNRK